MSEIHLACIEVQPPGMIGGTIRAVGATGSPAHPSSGSSFTAISAILSATSFLEAFFFSCRQEYWKAAVMFTTV